MVARVAVEATVEVAKALASREACEQSVGF